MAFPTEAVIGAGADIVGGAISTALAVKEAKRQRKWATKQYKHRYQWQMEDMRKAGLNPILMSMSGAGSTPGGQAARIPDMGSRGFSARGMAMAQHERQMNLLTEQAHHQREAARHQGHLGDLANQQTGIAKARNAVADQLAASEVVHNAANAQHSVHSARQAKVVADAFERMGTGGQIMRMIAPAITAGAMLPLNSARTASAVANAYRSSRMFRRRNP